MSRSGFRDYISENAASLPRPAGPGKTVPDRFAGPPPSPGGHQSGAAGGNGRAGAGAPPPPPPPSTLTPPPATGTGDGARLPEFKCAAGIVPGQFHLPELLIDGLLHRGCKIMFAGGSKSFKSWVLLDMAISVAEGLPFWTMATKKGRVLYLNFELIDAFFEERVFSVSRARQSGLSPNLFYWNLRGHCYDLQVLAAVIMARLEKDGPFDLIIVDPVYKALGDLDENSASDMTKLMNLLEVITVRTGAAVAFGSHFAKGNAAAKEAKDRPSGSGVLIRDPDVILTMTRHTQEHCYVVDAELRYLAPISPFVLRWNFPLMQADESLDPRDLYRPDAKSDVKTADGGPGIYSEQEMADVLPHGGAIDTLWRKLAALRFGKIGAEFYPMKASLLAKGIVRKSGLKYERTNLSLSGRQ